MKKMKEKRLEHKQIGWKFIKLVVKKNKLKHIRVIIN